MFRPGEQRASAARGRDQISHAATYRYRMRKTVFFLLVCSLLSAVHPLHAAEPYQVSSAMFVDADPAKEQYQFTPYEKIYLVLTVRNLPPGPHNLAVDWITPFGSLERQTSHTITATDTVSAFKVSFWFKLMKRGPLKRTLTGQDYKEEFYGEWKVNYYLDGLPVGSRGFEVH